MRRVAFWSIWGVLLASAGPALSITIVVPPGPGTPVQDAIDAASPGDTIRLTLGAYSEGNLVITKALKLRGVRSSSTQAEKTTAFAPPCGSGPVLTIAADGVSVRGIWFVGAPEGALRIVGSNDVRLRDLSVSANCPTTTAPAIDIEASTRVTADKIGAIGAFTQDPPIGIRIADTPPNGRVRVRTAIAAHYAIGVLLDGNGDGSVLFGSGYVNFNDRGIVVRDTAGAAILRNRQVRSNTITGIEIEAGSTGNVVVGNQIAGSALDVVDAGSGNCWQKNTFTTGVDPGCP